MSAQPTHDDLPNAAFSAAMDELFNRAFPESQTVDLPSGGQTECSCAMTESSMRTCQRHGEEGWLACDGCGRDDCVLTETICGTWACIDCIGDAAYDSEGDRR